MDLSTDRSDVAFHFNPRFNDNGEKVIVRNSFIDQKWGPEERHLDSFPFAPGEPFEVRPLPSRWRAGPGDVADVSSCCR